MHLLRQDRHTDNQHDDCGHMPHRLLVVLHFFDSQFYIGIVCVYTTALFLTILLEVITNSI